MIVDIGFGPVLLHVKWGHEVQICDKDGGPYSGKRVSLDLEDDEESGFSFDRFGVYSDEDYSDLEAIIATAGTIAGHFNEINAERIAEAKMIDEAELMNAEFDRARRDEVLEERRERLLHEFVGDEVRVRERGYKAMTRVRVRVDERATYNSEGDEDGGVEYQIRFPVVGGSSRYVSHRLDDILRLDVKDSSGRWACVWDDGKDDLPSWDRGKEVKIRPYNGG
jgi:hypothetical protein